MERPSRFEHSRYVGDKRSLVVYDLDGDDPELVERVAELMESQHYLSFGPDTLAEARNRGYRPFRTDDS